MSFGGLDCLYLKGRSVRYVVGLHAVPILTLPALGAATAAVMRKNAS